MASTPGLPLGQDPEAFTGRATANVDHFAGLLAAYGFPIEDVIDIVEKAYFRVESVGKEKPAPHHAYSSKDLQNKERKFHSRGLPI